MILLDTHIWYRWVQEPTRLTPRQERHLLDNEPLGLGVSVISCWEIAKLVEYKRMLLSVEPNAWIRIALAYRGIHLLSLTPEIAVESTQLPGSFHRDPADQMLVATARVFGISMLTADSKILAYPHVNLLV